HIITLSLLQEALSIDSEHFFWSKLTSDYPEAFPDLPHLTNYNRRRKQYRTAPDKGYSASLDHYFIGYKLHVVLTLDGVYHSRELTKGSVHDSQYLAEIKHSGLRDCLLLADKGYLSAQGQTELFASKGIDLQTPMRRNQHGYSP